MSYAHERELELQKQVIPQTKKDDFEAFWNNEMKKLREVPIEIEREKLDTPFDKYFTTYEITYNTHDKTKVHAYFTVPNDAKGKKLPCIARYHGGSLSKKIYLEIVSAGVCCFAIDVRSQGGTTVDMAEYQSGDRVGHLMTRGVLDKENFYMKNIYLDAARAVDVIATLPEVDPERIVTYGVSQGGALAIAAAALTGKAIKTYASIPSFICIKQRIEKNLGFFGGIHTYLRHNPQYTDLIFDNVTYFDINNMVSLLKNPVTISMGLTDPECLPQFVYSAYSHIPTEKDITLEPFVPHSISEEFYNRVFREFSEL